MGRATREPLGRSAGTLGCSMWSDVYGAPRDGDVCTRRRPDELIQLASKGGAAALVIRSGTA